VDGQAWRIPFYGRLFPYKMEGPCTEIFRLLYVGQMQEGQVQP